MLTVYVGGDPGEQGRESGEGEMGKEDKPVKRELLSLFTEAQSCWGPTEGHQNCPSKWQEARAFIK